jgi:serine/threonine protein kinase
MNKTEENIIIDSKMSKDIKMPKEKQNNIRNIKLNNSVNIVSADHENKKNNSFKLIQTTEKLIFKTRHSINKRNSKFKPTNKISEQYTNMKAICPNKKIKKISDLNDVNRDEMRISLTQQKSLIETSLSMEKISPTNFICLAQLGKGSFGEVYLVKKLNTEEKYAMKVLSKDRIMSQNLLKYAIAERNVLSTSNHPFIVKLSYAFQTSSRLFLVIEYCPNGDLSRHLVFEKRFKEERAKFYLCEVLLALEDLHKRDIIFRDLKPDNVVLDKDGHCKLTDFGLSKEGVGRDIYAQSFCGSIAYLAPEMLKKKGHTKAVDWYLLGVLFYEMLVGVTPYFTTRKEEIFYNIEFGDLKIPNFVSKEAAELLLRLLERDPAKRLGGGGRDALEIKEHPYFKDVDWKKIYEKKIKPPFFMNYMDKAIKFYHKPKLFANDEFLNKTENGKQVSNILKGWSFINPNESI